VLGSKYGIDEWMKSCLKWKLEVGMRYEGKNVERNIQIFEEA